MTTTRYVVAPREPTPHMLRAIEIEWLVGSQADMAKREYTAMLAAIPDDPAAPVLVNQDELAALRRDAERYRWLRMEVHDGFWQLGEIEVLDSFGSSQCNLVSDCVDIDAACDRAIAAIAAKERGT